MEKKKIITTNRLILREVQISDLNDWYEIFNSDKVGKYLTKYTDKDKVSNLINKKIDKFKNTQGSSFSVVLDNKVIGSVEIKVDQLSNTAEISYVFNEKYWNKGYATESAKALLDYAFNYLDVTKVFADCKETNDISIHMLTKKLNMTFDKYEPNYMFDESLNSYIGFNFYSLSKKDYLNNTK